MIDDIEVSPVVWAGCPTCKRAYIVRRVQQFSPTDGSLRWVWVWSRDCRHTLAPCVMNADGPITAVRR